uniref:Uncharacterized protein n=1 Tax=Aegilops tauschii subsp. strangulata TaxID=200361 RepID=A0A453MEB0_AEGTS
CDWGQVDEMGGENVRWQLQILCAGRSVGDPTIIAPRVIVSSRSSTQFENP